MRITTQSGDIHLKSAGLKAALNYLRTHAYETEDRRPDTNNIPTRTWSMSPTPARRGRAPSSEDVSSSAVEEKTEYQAGYRVDKTGGGTLNLRTKSRQVSYRQGDQRRPDCYCYRSAGGRLCVRQVERWRDQAHPHG